MKTFMILLALGTSLSSFAAKDILPGSYSYPVMTKVSVSQEKITLPAECISESFLSSGGCFPAEDVVRDVLSVSVEFVTSQGEFFKGIPDMTETHTYELKDSIFLFEEMDKFKSQDPAVVKQAIKDHLELNSSYTDRGLEIELKAKR